MEQKFDEHYLCPLNFEMKEKNMEEYSTTATMVKVAIFNRVCRNDVHIKI